MKSANNLVLLTVPIQLILAMTVYLFITFNSDNQSNLDNFSISILVMCIAAFLENLSEPFYIHMLLTGDMQPRIKTECVGILLKSVATYYLLINNFNLLAYSLSQLLYSVSLLLAASIDATQVGLAR